MLCWADSTDAGAAAKEAPSRQYARYADQESDFIDSQNKKRCNSCRPLPNGAAVVRSFQYNVVAYQRIIRTARHDPIPRNPILTHRLIVVKVTKNYRWAGKVHGIKIKVGKR